MNKPMIRKIVQTLSFIIMLCALFALFQSVFCYKYPSGIYHMRTFYRQQRNSIDVIFIGSSHVFADIDPSVLWDEYGMASFDLAGGIQPMWNSYFFIKEALKTQKPRLAAVDILGAWRDWEDYGDSGMILCNNFGMRPSLNKMFSVMASAPKRTWPQYMLEFPMYHTRYTELRTLDFFPSRGAYDGGEIVMGYKAWKGHILSYEAQKYAHERPVGIETDEIGTVKGKFEKYLRKICALCQDKNVPLLLIKTPYVSCTEQTKAYNRAAQIAAEYGIPFVNFNYYVDEMGIDFAEDFADVYSHMNYKGCRVFSRYLGAYIKARYDIPDRRGEKGYDSYRIIASDAAERLRRLDAGE